MAHIQQKLDFFYHNRQIPNLLFHGASGTGKRTIIYQFLEKIYGGDKHKMKTNTMLVNCAHGKGIKFIREELKFFAKTNIQCNSGIMFKSIVLLNADSLTVDAQSALRRCIELFSHSTRFFIIVENKHKLLNPILSRFCEIHVSEHMENGKIVNLHKRAIDTKYRFDYDTEKKGGMRDILSAFMSDPDSDPTTLVDLCNKIYDLGYSCLDLMEAIKESTDINEEITAKTSILFQKIKGEYRCEKLLMFYLFISLK